MSASARERYEVFESLGRNDYLAVHRGWDRRLRRAVAIMELDRKFRANERQYDRVWDEVLSFAGIEHFGLVRVYEVDKENGWIITELMQGTLAARISESGLSSDEVREVLRTGLEAVGYLHGRGKLHGDVRPSNLMIDDEGHVRLSHPFGLEIGGQVPRRTMNQKYLAPELVKPEFGAVGLSMDLYCLGFSAYELLVGPRFDEQFAGVRDPAGTGSGAVLGWLRWHAADDARLPAVKDVVAGVADDVAKTIDRLICKRVEERPANADDALGMLAASEGEEVVFQVDDSSSHPPPSPGPRPERESHERGEAIVSTGNQNIRRTPKTAQIPTRPRDSQPRAWTRQWIEQKLKNPRVFWSLAAAVLGMAAVGGLALRQQSSSNGQSEVNGNNGGTSPPSDRLEEIKQLITKAHERLDALSIESQSWGDEMAGLKNKQEELSQIISDADSSHQQAVDNLDSSLQQAVDKLDSSSHVVTGRFEDIAGMLGELHMRINPIPPQLSSDELTEEIDKLSAAITRLDEATDENRKSLDTAITHMDNRLTQLCPQESSGGPTPPTVVHDHGSILQMIEDDIKFLQTKLGSESDKETPSAALQEVKAGRYLEAGARE